MNPEAVAAGLVATEDGCVCGQCESGSGSSNLGFNAEEIPCDHSDLPLALVAGTEQQHPLASASIDGHVQRRSAAVILIDSGRFHVGSFLESRQATLGPIRPES